MTDDERADKIIELLGRIAARLEALATPPEQPRTYPWMAPVQVWPMACGVAVSSDIPQAR